MKIDLQWLCNELISALVTGGAQGGLIIGLVWLALRFSARANAATRHGAWFATLLVAAGLPVAHFVSAIWEKLPATPTPVPAISEPVSAPAIDFEQIVSLAEPVVESVLPPVELSSAATAPAIIETQKESNWAVNLPRNVSLGLVLCWAMLAAIRVGGLARQLWILRSVKARALAAPEMLSEPFDEIVAGMGISRRPRLLISEEAAAPMVVGFLKP